MNESRLVLLLNRRLSALGGAFVFATALAAYVSTLAPAPVPGDPSEYTFIPWILGIAHPPGYAFYTLLAALWQRLVPIGSVAYRTHLLAAAAGAASATLVYATVLTLTPNSPTTQPPNHPITQQTNRLTSHLAALFAALSFAFAADIWQHSIHTNAHIITLLLATASIFLLVRWQATHDDRWLYAFALVAGLSPAQHPLLVLAFPAYVAFILAVRLRILRQPRTLLTLIAFAAIGLSVFLYYPLRSPVTPFGVSDINSWESFLHFVTAEGLRVNLFAFGLAEQPVRLSVFFNLVQLQYPLFSLLLAVIGWIRLATTDDRGPPPFGGQRSAKRPIFFLLTLFFLVLYAFVMNTIQDVMAYLMLPFMMIAVLIGIGAGAMLSALSGNLFTPRLSRAATRIAAVALVGLTVATPLLRAPRISLRDYTVGWEWVQRVHDRFDGQGEGAFLLASWEALTPLWVEQFTNNHSLEPRDVTLVYVAANAPNPWLDSVFAHFERGPLYLADYRRQVVEGGLFRLQPDGGSPPLWRVVAPGDTGLPAFLTRLNVQAEGQIEVLGFALDGTSLRAGETAHLTLAMRAPTAPAHVLMPYALVGDRAYRWTTDSRVLSTRWLPGEVIVERYEITLPFSTPPGEYSLALGVTDLTEGRDLRLRESSETAEVFETISLGALRVDPPRLAPDISGQNVLADFGAQVALVGASAAANGQTAHMESEGVHMIQPGMTLEEVEKSPLTYVAKAWTPPLVVRPGQSIQVWLDWQALQQPLDNYKVFVHLITPGEQLAAPPADFYTPLGGAFPTHLWIPKWIEGQRASDPYTLVLPPDLPPGEYRIQVGLYGLTSNRRVYVIGQDGSLAGDRVILGPVVVQ